MAALPESPLELDVAPEPERWVVLHSRPRCEKKLADAARRAGALVYLPLHVRTHRYGARERTFQVPLFPGYVFCRAPVGTRQWLRQNQYAATLLDVTDQGLLVRQLRQVQAALSADLLVEIMPFLETGRKVRIVAGPLRGSEGIVQRIQGRTRVLLNIDMIRQAVAVEMDSASLAPL